jgi:hypothetical protein
MGGQSANHNGARVLRVDSIRNVIVVSGPVPGYPGSAIRITDSIKRTVKAFAPNPPPLPFPTFLEKFSSEKVLEIPKPLHSSLSVHET